MTEPPPIVPQTPTTQRLRDALAVTLASAALGALIMAISNLIANRDLAGRLASDLGLGSSAALGAVLGAITSAWLALGGRRRIAGFIGLIFGIGAAALLWRVAQPSIWVVDALLEGAFGPGAGLYSGLAVMVVLYLVIRIVADAVAVTATRLVRPSAGRS